MFLKVAVIFTLLTIITHTFAAPHHMPSSPYVHRAVLENDAQEAYFPEHYKNPFYKTPRVRNVLARFSWLQHGETPVQNRIADSVPRKEIYKLLTHAGFIAREDFPYA